MVKRLILILVLTMTVGMAVGCGDGSGSVTEPQFGDLQQLFTTNMKNVSFEMTVDQSDKAKSTMYFLNGAIRIDSVDSMGRKQAMIINDQTQEQYILYPDDKEGMKIPYYGSNDVFPPTKIMYCTQSGGNVTFVETVSLNDAECAVFNAVCGDGTKAKVWIQKSTGIPFKTEITGSDGKLKTYELKNVNAGNVDANVFAISSDWKISGKS